MKRLLLTSLEFAVMFLKEEWRPFALMMLSGVRRTEWANEDTRWDELSVVIEKWLRDVIRAQSHTDGAILKQMRLAAEVAATRELRRLNVLRPA
jgi:hypothetical protein